MKVIGAYLPPVRLTRKQLHRLCRGPARISRFRAWARSARYRPGTHRVRSTTFVPLGADRALSSAIL